MSLTILAQTMPPHTLSRSLRWVADKIRHFNTAASHSEAATRTHFPAPYIISPISEHKHTIIALHGLGSNGRTFADRLLFGAPYSDQPTPLKKQQFSTWTNDLPVDKIRFVFATAPVREIKTPFERTAPAWFEISSLIDLEIMQEQQMSGLRESVNCIGDVVQHEIDLLQSAHRSSEDLFVIGRSQGSSVAGWTLMTGRLAGIGGVILAGSWLVLARALQQALTSNTSGVSTTKPIPGDSLSFTQEMIKSGPGLTNIRNTPVLMGHSTDDEWISVELGRQFRDVLESAGYNPTWKEYVGAEEEGHWFKDPEEFQELARFISQRIKS